MSVNFSKLVDLDVLAYFKAKIDLLFAAISIPTKTSDLNNDSGFITTSDIPEGAAASSAAPAMDGAASAGSSNAFARGDHVHPHDTSKVDVSTYNAFVTQADNAITGLAGEIDSLEAAVYTKAQVDALVSATYKAAGTVTFQNLPALSAANLGKVVNVSDSFTTTSNFVEGAGKTHPGGTNVAIVDIGPAGSPSYKYDVQSGFVDLSGYAQSSDFGLATTSEIDALFT